MWVSGPSDVSGCTNLHSPVKAEPVLSNLGLADPDVPLQLLLEQMLKLGWSADDAGDKRATTQLDCNPAVFKLSMLKSRSKPYFHCLVFLPDLFARGLQRFNHGLSVSYYQRLLKSKEPAKVDESVSAAEHHKVLKDLEPVVLQLEDAAGFLGDPDEEG